MNSTQQPTSILVTGANGFIGGSLVAQLAQLATCKVTAAVRTNLKSLPSSVVVFENLDVSKDCDWTNPLKNVDCVIHCAARVHVMKESAVDPLGEFRRINTDGTLRLAEAAAKSGVTRFIFLSTLKVNGEATRLGAPFSADDDPEPSDPYAISKMEAEVGLKGISAKTGLEITIVRPPLVYGPNVGANFLSMMRLVNRGVPLPFGFTKNKRSFVALGNLTDLVMTCVWHPAAANQIFLVSDGDDLSTTQLLTMLGEVLKKKAILFPVPPSLLAIAALCIGKRAIAQRLLGSLQVDMEKTKVLLGWTPPLAIKEAMMLAADSFRRGNRAGR